MTRKNLNTSVSIPLWQLIATALLLYLLPPPETVETYLLFVLKYKQSVLVVKLLTVALIIMIPIQIAQKRRKPLTVKERNELLKIIKDMTEARYSMHTSNVLSKNFDEILSKEALRGFERPTGALAGAISELYISDIGVYSNFLEDAISKAISNINTNKLHHYLSGFANEMLTQNNEKIKSMYDRFAHGYFDSMGIKHLNLMKTSFASEADIETNLRIKHLLSITALDKIT